MIKHRLISMISVVFLLLIGAAFFVVALPEGPQQLDTVTSSRRTVSDTTNISALAGNVTQLNISGEFVTQSWQGYYGNITGTLVLDTSDGNRMFSWDIAAPQGEIYATEGTSVPVWGQPGETSTIECWNYTHGESTSIEYPFYGEVEGWDSLDGDGSANAYSQMGSKENAPDSINNTFKRTSSYSFPSFYVGTKFINGTENTDKCPSVALYNYSNTSTYGGAGNLDPSAGAVAVGGDFQEVILIDTTNYYLIYTAITDIDGTKVEGFDGNHWDFQMIVPEDGHSGDVSTTEYNFYVELE